MEQSLAGRRVLVVEDEFFLAIELEDALYRSGADVVGPLTSVGAALDRTRERDFDSAVLDINLGGTLVYPVADALAAAGIPFLFASAYTMGDIPARHRSRRLVGKPYELATLVDALAELGAGAA